MAQFDRDGNGRLSADERRAAMVWLSENRPQRGPGGRFPPGPPRGPEAGGPFDGGPVDGINQDTQAVGSQIAKAGVASYADRDVFDPDIVRTVFLDLPDANWFEELTAFYRTDVQVPATVTIDGQSFPDVGTGFRGNTSFMMVRGKKKSWDLQFDFVDGKQSWRKLRNLDLINCNEDPSFLREMLHGWVANQFFPAQRVGLVRLVVNGEDFGIYAAVQQFDKEFLRDHFGTGKGDRWKVPPDFSGDGGLRWLGDQAKDYERIYQLKSAPNEAAWAGLIALCAVLDRTPTEELEGTLPQLLDVDGALWFLAIDNALADDDGYFSRASDYVLYRDPVGCFHVLPRDNNEVLGAGGRPGPQGGGPGGPGGGPDRGPPERGGPERGGPDRGGPPDRGPRGARRGPGGGTATSPLQGATRTDRPLLHRLLAVPAWRERYLSNLRALATTALADDTIRARLESWHRLLQPIVQHDVHAQFGMEAFERSFASDEHGAPAPGSLRAVIAARRRAILEDAALAGEWPELADLQAERLIGDDGAARVQVRCRSNGTSVTLFASATQLGLWATTPMFDDGRHGDGASGDGVFGATVTSDAGKDLRLWVQATASSAHVVSLPLGGSAKPYVLARASRQ